MPQQSFKHIVIVALLGALFGISEWFYSILGILYALTGIQHPALVYITWAGLPTIIVIYESIATRRVLLAYFELHTYQGFNAKAQRRKEYVWLFTPASYGACSITVNTL